MGKNKPLVKLGVGDGVSYLDLIETQRELISILEYNLASSERIIDLQKVLITNLELRKIDYEKKWFVFKPWELFKK
jgi:hypothetical protein